MEAERKSGNAAAAAFMERWSKSGGSETSNSQTFLNELCDLLDVPRPEPAVSDDDENRYVFEKRFAIANGDGTTSPGFADLYKAGCFVLESKQGVEAAARKAAADGLAASTRSRKTLKGHADRGTTAWQRVMQKARQQARRYAQNAPADHGWPVFLVVCDVGHCLDLYADFTRSGRTYQPFPDPRAFRVRLEDLRHEETRDLLQAVWTDPQSLDPSATAAAVTRGLAEKLARLAKSLESEGHEPKAVAAFLMRCLFTMFAEDVGLFGFADEQAAGRFRKRRTLQPFTKLMQDLRDDPATFGQSLESVWTDMDGGGFSGAFRQKVRRFNGAFFKERFTLPLSKDQIELLIEAAEADWSDVEPAIFGTLIERALDPVERHKLGAHFTPRAYVERLVEPTIMEPLRDEWEGVHSAAAKLLEEAEAADTKDAAKLRDEAARLVRDFHHTLCETRVLDPACGSGNFLYVALELMKRLEGEVIDFLRQMREEPPIETIDPRTFLGIEINPRAAAIAELVLWIGYLKWHFRARGYENIPEPVLRDYSNIECRDAVLAYDEKRVRVGEDGRPVTHWDGRTTKLRNRRADSAGCVLPNVHWFTRTLEPKM